MTGGALSQYSSLLHSPHNKRKSYSVNKTHKAPKTGVGKTSKKPRVPSPEKCSPARKLDLKSPRYFTSPENDEIDFARHSHRDKPRCSPIKESTSAAQRQAAIDMMIQERSTTSPKTPKKKEKSRSDRENVWEARKNEALLDASNIERGILKDILFSETTKSLSRDSSITRSGPVYKEILSPRLTSPRIELNNLTLPDSEVENNAGDSPRNAKQETRNSRSETRNSRSEARDTFLTPSPEKRDMSSSYKEDDFRASTHRGREDKSINTSPVRWDTSPARRDTAQRTSPSRPRSPKKPSQKKRHSEDTLDTISDLESRYCETPGSPKKVSFSEDTITADRNLQIHRLERDVQQRDLEILEMKQLCHQFKQRLGESETLRIALESEKLRLSLQNITHSPRTPAYNVAPAGTSFLSSTPAHVTSPQQGVTSLQPHATTTYQVPQEEPQVSAPAPEPPVSAQPNVSSNPGDKNIHMGTNLTNACNDITEVNSMIQQMKLENDALKAGLKEASIKTQQQTRQLEDRLQSLEKEKDRIAEENRRYQRLIAQDDKGSRIAMLQRDLQNQMSENEKLKQHLQSLRENYTKFFGASI